MIDITVDVKWYENKIASKINKLVDDSTMLQIQKLFAETINPYTPYWHGPLSEKIKIDSTGVTYLVDYARKQYYGSKAIHKDVHPLATKLWDEVAMQSEMGNFEAKVKEILVERAKELYG